MVKVVATGIRKMKISYLACVLPILLSLYLNLHICPSKFSANDM